ncbi:unnamed protein product [Amoebophrya sp. A120]|nr:unnamed protein product [Amoebophrya sp. A120]|eukprot:GSA120T00011416001.1
MAMSSGDSRSSVSSATLAVLATIGCAIFAVAVYIVATEEEPEAKRPNPVPEQQQKSVPKKRPFYPSYEWKVVAEDQMVPPGLEIRMNLETGQNEARLPTPPGV